MSEGIPTDAQIREKMEEMMQVVDLETMSTKQFIAALSDKFNGVDLSSKKKYIKATITEIIDSMESDDDDQPAAASEEEESSSEEEEEPKPKKRRGGGGGGLAAIKEISVDLANLLGTGRMMARTEIVKKMWEYIKENDLQNPNNRREILLDDKMKAVFGCDSFTMFTLNKYLGAHIDPYKPVDLTTPSAATLKKRKAKKENNGEPKKKRGSGLQAPYRLSEDLASVVGKSILPRPQVTQALWAYIRENNLQNPEDKREILCDEALSRIMGGESKVTMFSMNKYISPHMLEKVDKSEYQHEEIDIKKGAGEVDSDDIGEVEENDDE